MKYYKTDDGRFGYQTKVPSFATEITEAEYLELKTAFDNKQNAIADYVTKVQIGVVALGDVPKEYFSEVEAIINTPEPEPTYTLDEAATLIAQEVASNG